MKPTRKIPPRRKRPTAEITREIARDGATWLRENAAWLIALAICGVLLAGLIAFAMSVSSDLGAR